MTAKGRVGAIERRPATGPPIACVRCRKETAPTLHSGIPHICSRCLFPPVVDSRELVQAVRYRRT